MKWSAKRVESSGVPCLDAGSTPATSTLSLRFMSQAFFCLIGVAVSCGKAPTRSYEKAKAFTFDPRINKGKSNYVFLVLRVTPPCTHT